MALDGLEPAAGCAGELHSGTLNPHRWIDGVEVEIAMSAGHPILGIFAVEVGEMHFGKVAEIGIVVR